MKINLSPHAVLTKLRIAGLLALLLGTATVVYAQVGGTFDLSWSTIDGGGGTVSTGGIYTVGGTIGQADAGIQTGGQFTIQGGFWGGAQQGPQPTPTGTATSLPTQTPGGPTATPIPTNTRTNTPTPIPTDTPTYTPSITPTIPPTQTPGGPTATPGASTPTPTSCPAQFEDVPVGSTFYDFVRCMVCRGIINGYPCGSPGEPCNPPNNYPYYRPNNNVTRGQIAKIVSNSAGFNDPVRNQTFEDVPAGSTFYLFIERLVSRDVMQGYPCGGPGEPCVPPENRPYFRPNNSASRGQLSKIVSNAANFNDPALAQTFEDVPEGSTFYLFIERLVAREVMQGYPCGGPGEPCNPPTNRPYFRPGSNVTRGQTAKIVANTFLPGCETP